MKCSNLHRAEIIERLKNEEYDVLIIGGGITGAGIALDAQTRGLKVALVEMQDFAAGTSSRSTKLVHGGLRYLKQMEIGMVAEVGKERAIVYENGPHVTTPEWMLLPIHKGGTFGKLTTSIGLRVYDFLAGVRKTERRRMLSAEETLAKEPLLKTAGLKGGGYYVEYRTDDARLTMEVMKAAWDKGATALNYSKVTKLVYEDTKAAGAFIKDQLTGEEYQINAKKVINAAGPWVDAVREMDQSKSGKTLQLSKGIHVVIDQSRFPLKQAVYFDTLDGRMIFAIPRDGKAYVGTTDTFYNGEIATPSMTVSDRDYLIKAINYMFPEVQIREDDVESSWAGVRPLIYEEGKSASEISRKDEIWESDSGLITIAGGKLTGYRKMAEMVADLVAEKFRFEEGKTVEPCQTKHMPISGGDVGGSGHLDTFVTNHLKRGVELGLSPDEAEGLVRTYGSNIHIVFDLMVTNQAEASQSGLPLQLYARLDYAIDHELAATALDFLNRRTGAILFDIHSVRKWKEQVIAHMAKRLSWSDTEIERNRIEVDQALKECVTPSAG